MYFVVAIWLIGKQENSDEIAHSRFYNPAEFSSLPPKKTTMCNLVLDSDNHFSGPANCDKHGPREKKEGESKTGLQDPDATCH